MDHPINTYSNVCIKLLGGEAFAPLLNYMYTGRLEVTLDNIYSVLLATHLLHMPGALEQCRTALLRLRAAPLPPVPCEQPRIGNVLRPVPSRLVGPPLCWPQPILYPSGSVNLTHLPTLPLPTTISTLPMQIIHETSSSPYRLDPTFTFFALAVFTLKDAFSIKMSIGRSTRQTGDKN